VSTIPSKAGERDGEVAGIDGDAGVAHAEDRVNRG